MAFEAIIRCVSISPSIRLVLRYHLEYYGPVEAMTFSWKRPRVNCGVGWTQLHALVSHCLEHSELLVDAYSQVGSSSQRDFFAFERMLFLCRYVRLRSRIHHFSTESPGVCSILPWSSNLWLGHGTVVVGISP